jgi:hypothetical protein
MANVLGELFQEIADAIRTKTGGTVTMAPMSFPDEISAIPTGVDSDEIDKTLDEINGEVVGETLYYVTFIGADGTQLHQEPVYEGYDCPNPISTGAIATPTKESTKYETYAYSGWAKTSGGSASASALKAIAKNTTLYAAFTATKIYVAQGTCGTNVKWTLDPDYAMVISGSGGMTNYTGSTNTGVADTPWWDYRDQITSVTVDTGVTKVGNYSFFHCSALTRASLPSTLSGVAAIGWSAFEGCVSLTDINIPIGVSALQSDTFSGCASLESIEIPAKVASIKGDVFTGCTVLTSIVMGATDGWSLYATDGTLVTTYTTGQMSDPAQVASILVNNTYHTGQFKRTNS